MREKSDMIKAMKQALEALEYFDGEYDVKDEITALRAAIAEASMQRLTDVQQEMEPVAWMSQGGDVSRSKKYFDEMGFVDLIPLFTHLPRREWVSLTDEEIFKCVGLEKLDALRYLEAKLKEKNS